MKNRKFILIAILLTLLITVLGCGTSNTNDASSSQQQNSQYQGRMNSADLRGQVISIKDNKITLKLIKTPEFKGNNSQNNRNRNNTNSTNHPNSNGNGYGNKNNNNKNNQSNRGFQRKLEFTGKTQTLTIAKDTVITTRKRGQNGMDEENLSISDIKNNSIIQVWLSEKDKNTISKITLTNMQN